jgi:uncharacterized protein DUF5818
MRWIVASLALLALSGSRCSDSAPEPQGRMTVRGTLTGEGVECPALRDAQGVLYTLAGDIADFRMGDQVCVKGRRVEMSTCQQGITIAVEWIGKTCPD